MQNTNQPNDHEPRRETQAEVLARINQRGDFNIDEVTDEELAILFPNFAAVWADVMRLLVDRELLKNSLQGDDQTG